LFKIIKRAVSSANSHHHISQHPPWPTPAPPSQLQAPSIIVFSHRLQLLSPCLH